jgi:hypothetical protein
MGYCCVATTLALSRVLCTPQFHPPCSMRGRRLV